MTDRNREGTLSPTNPDANRRLSSNNRDDSSSEWNDLEEPYIKKWVDYSNKYGVGYTLTNDACGAYFNDNSKLVVSSDNFCLHYFDKGPDRVEVKESYTMKNYPQ